VKRCGAKTRSGGPCKRAAGWGTEHADAAIGRCRLHGGSTRTHRAAARRELAAQAVITYGLPRDVDPRDALTEELHRTAGAVAWLGSQVQSMEADELAERVGGGQGAIPSVEPHVWVRLYRVERKHLADVAKTCIACGIEERRVRIAEGQGEMIAQVLRGVLSELGVADLPETREVVRRHLILIADE